MCQLGCGFSFCLCEIHYTPFHFTKYQDGLSLAFCQSLFDRAQARQWLCPSLLYVTLSPYAWFSSGKGGDLRVAMKVKWGNICKHWVQGLAYGRGRRTDGTEERPITTVLLPTMTISNIYSSLKIPNLTFSFSRLSRK